MTALWGVIAGAATAIIAVAAAWMTGRRSGDQRAARKGAQGYVDTRRRMDTAGNGDDDPDAVRARLERLRDGR